MSDKMRNLLVRTLSGAVLTVVVVGAVLWSQWSFGVLLLAILVGGMWEFYRMARREDIYPLKWLGLVTGTALFVASFLLAVSAEQVALLPRALSVLLWLLPVFILLIPLMFVCELFLKRARPAADVGGDARRCLLCGRAFVDDGLSASADGEGWLESLGDFGLHLHYLGQRRIRLPGGGQRRPTSSLRADFAQQVVGGVLRRHRRCDRHGLPCRMVARR